jgi:hypothetical protein
MWRSRVAVRTLGSLALLCCCSLPAHADEDMASAEAKRAYGLATQAYAAKRFVEAALAFEASASYKANAVTLYTAALSWEQAGHSDRAADAFTRSLELPDLLPQQRQNAEERLVALERTLGTVRVTGPSGTRAQLDASSESGVPARMHAPPGTHTLAVRWADGAAERRDVTLTAGEVQAIALTRPAPSVACDHTANVVALVVPTPAVHRSTSGTPARVAIGFGLAGVGVGAGLAAIVLGVSAVDAGSASRAAPTSAPMASHAAALTTWTHVAWVSGAVLLASGLALALWPTGQDGSRVALVPMPNGVAIAGRL